MKVNLNPNESFKPVWNGFVENSPNGSLTQSWIWGNFLDSIGEETIRLAVTSSELSSDSQDFLAAKSQVLGVMLLVKREAKFFNYYFAPYGPVLGEIKMKDTFGQLMAKSYQLCRDNNIDFIRLEPKLSLDNYLTVRPVDDTAQAQHTLIIDIDKEEKEIMANMKSKWRYNIRLAEKKGVRIKQAETVEEIGEFWELLKQNSIDNSFSTHSKEYYHRQLEILSGEDMEVLLLAKKGKKTIAANLVGFYGPTAYYLHGAMNRQYSNLMAPHLLQWHSIKLAKDRGCKNYDMFGIASPSVKKDHPWQGFSRFKRGFAPETQITSYPGAYFIGINQAKFAAYKSIKKVKNYFDL